MTRKDVVVIPHKQIPGDQASHTVADENNTSWRVRIRYVPRQALAAGADATSVTITGRGAGTACCTLAEIEAGVDHEPAEVHARWRPDRRGQSCRQVHHRTRALPDPV